MNGEIGPGGRRTGTVPAGHGRLGEGNREADLVRQYSAVGPAGLLTMGHGDRTDGDAGAGPSPARSPSQA